MVAEVMISAPNALIGGAEGIIAAVAAVGPASFSLVDATKVWNGGISNVGFGFIRDAMSPFLPALKQIDEQTPLGTIRANWLNSVPKDQQKQVARDLVRLGLTTSNVVDIAKGLPGVDGPALATAVSVVASGGKPTEADLNVLSRFDAILDARLEAGFERADQKYRNAAQVAAAGVAIVLAQVAGQMVGSDVTTSLIVGIAAVPLAPVSKDLTSALQVAVKALKTAKG